MGLNGCLMMPNRRIILAKAGAGKTKYVTEHPDNVGKRILYLTFTNENITNIKERVSKTKHNPNDISISTFHSFLLKIFFKPFLNDFETKINHKLDLSSGLNWKIESQIKAEPGRKFAKKETVMFWSDSSNRLYGNRLSGLILYTDSAFQKGLYLIQKYYDLIVVDEFQDFTGDDFKILKKLIQSIQIDILYVGDVYQANVTTTASTLIPYKDIFENEVEFVSNIFQSKKFEIEIDNTSFTESKRITKNVADFVREKLDIEIYSNRNDSGNIIFIDDLAYAMKVLNKVDIILTFNKKTRVPKIFEDKRMNWTISKGMTFNNVAVILTDAAYKKLIDPQKMELPTPTHNKLYVALTRSKENVYLFSNDLWKKILNNTVDSESILHNNKLQLELDFGLDS